MLVPAPNAQYSIAKIGKYEWLIDDNGNPVYPLEPFDWDLT